jgi:rod shape determining protein RodA
VAISSIYVSTVNYAFENVLQAHQKTRINVLLGKEVDLKGAGYNVQQSLIAIGSGGAFGKGYLEGTQNKFRFVPEQSTDFIFCTIGEEFGFLGSLIFVILYMLLLYRLLVMAERQRSKFNRVYGYSIIAILFFHFLINIGMTLGLMPVIGIPLPFFSYGGSALLSFTILLFIFIRLDANRVNELKSFE